MSRVRRKLSRGACPIVRRPLMRGGALHFKSGYLVLDLQLATLEFYQLEIVDGWMLKGLFDLLLQYGVLLFELCKMRLDGHWCRSSFARFSPDHRSVPRKGPEVIRARFVHCNKSVGL